MNPRPPLRFALLAAALTALLFGCATPSSIPSTAQGAWTARQATLAHLTTWRADGRIGVVSGQDGWHASFQWSQQDSGYHIDLSGPLGQGRVVVESDGAWVRIQTQDGRNWTAPDADDLLEQALGVRLPVNGLRYWARGLPEPGSPPVLQTDASGRLTRLEQQGWVIEYPAYTPTSRLNLDLPERIIARRQDLSVKLVIEQWTL
ncbi:MAG: lipoprotein insertase outer membrane protein LolB [Candidatus Contendobacter sp.]|nr:lipoprotein insertase outer membrane protein LolB [Candidatus Contendobacter sp.]MDS4057534.1 lipoprotein insertase outer membrane protein LolB [Candidatus Contendobacter sp.]